MRIHKLTRTMTGENARVAAEIMWEDSDRPAQEIYYEAAGPFAEELTCSPQAFLTAAFIPAMRQGERRLLVEGAICPELRDGLEVAMRWLHDWHGRARMPLAIEASVEARPASRAPRERAACFFTGGVDSMATLRWNRLRYPREHPSSIRDGIIIYGLEVEQKAAFQAVLQSLAAVAADTEMTLLPVSTNVRSLDEDWHFWEFEWEGAVYASVAHVLSARMSSASISSTYDIPNMNRLGSHPLLDPNYSSSTLRIRHDGMTMSRLDKVRLIADWDAGLQHLRVCNRFQQYREKTINCGTCEKCIRTMLGLAAVGALGRTKAFAGVGLTPDVVRRGGTIHSPYMKACYQELVAPLEAGGRHDLASAVKYVLAKYGGELGWRGSLRKLDRRVLGGRLRMAKRLLSAPGAA